jgi:hypothetical protein
LLAADGNATAEKAVLLVIRVSREGEETNAESEETWSILCTLDETNVKDDEETIFSLVLRTAFFKGVSLRRRAASVWRQKTHKWRRGEIVSQPSTINTT